MSELKKFQSIIGYSFNDEELLKQALTHSSYANEKHLKKLSDNERLEFLGDAVLELTSSEFLFANYPNLTEGELTKLRASIVCEPTLAACTEAIHLGHFLFLGKGFLVLADRDIIERDKTGLENFAGIHVLTLRHNVYSLYKI